MNILLMGLESRTDYQGNTLSSACSKRPRGQRIRRQQRGRRRSGHEHADPDPHLRGRAASGRVLDPAGRLGDLPKPYDGQSQGKIDQAYGLAWAQSLSSTSNSTISQDQRYLQANEAGQTAAIDSVEAVTGLKVDHFAEVNLAGFY